MVVIRKAQIEEAEGICACLNSAFEPFRSQYTAGAFDDTVPNPVAIRERMVPMKVYVAVTGDGEIVGTIASAMQGKEGYLRGMATRPAWQGRGIAEQLLHAAENDLLTAGCRRVTLDTTAPLERAIHFYRKNGFVPTGGVIDFFGMPLYEYAKPLLKDTAQDA
jgi:ribosomal protein S18 acetylase RimI-like enzyme